MISEKNDSSASITYESDREELPDEFDEDPSSLHETSYEVPLTTDGKHKISS